jgi:hypothetical protein
VLRIQEFADVSRNWHVAFLSGSMAGLSDKPLVRPSDATRLETYKHDRFIYFLQLLHGN